MEVLKPQVFKEECSDDASIAQLVEQGTLNPKVAGSIPAGRTRKIIEIQNMAGIVQWQDIGLWSQEPGFDSQYSPKRQINTI